MLYSIVKEATGTVISSKAKIATSFGLRLKGLMFDKTLDEAGVLIFHNAPAIHTCFMRFAIDVVFLDKDNRVIKIYEAVKPWKMVFCPSSKLTIELPSHRAARRCLEIGDKLDIALTE